MDKIGNRIKKRRIELGLSQDALAEQLGYKSRSSITNIEKGKTGIPAGMIEEFAKALNTSASYLFGWVNDPTEDWRSISKKYSDDYKKSMHLLFEVGLNIEQAEILMQFTKLDEQDQKAIMSLVTSLFNKQPSN